MKDQDTIDRRIELVTKRKKIYFFLGWPMLAVGAGIFFLGGWQAVAIGCIVLGMLVRLLYYFASSELRSLEKYGHLLNKSELFIFLSFIFFSIHLDLSAQLKRGNEALELSNIEWIGGRALKLIPENSGVAPIRVVEFWASWDQASQLSLPLLSKVQKLYGEDRLVVIALTKEERKKVEKYLEKLKTKNNFYIGIDAKGIISKAYLGDGGGIPRVFVVDNNDKIIWIGNPLELETVLDKIFKGKFDPAVQEEITALHNKLQLNVQMEQIPAAIRNINKIMELDPSDALAMRVRLYIFERSGKLVDALPFIDNLIEKSPETSSLYFVKLDLMNRLNKSQEEVQTFCRVIFDKFNKSSDVLEHLAWIAVFRMPLGSAPIEIALDSIEKAVSMLIESDNQNPAKLANYLETQGRLYYMIGKIAQALEIQGRVVNLRKGDRGEKQSVLLQKYYKKVLELKNR